MSRVALRSTVHYLLTSEETSKRLGYLGDDPV
jgi:hypothetical protein